MCELPEQLLSILWLPLGERSFVSCTPKLCNSELSSPELKSGRSIDLSRRHVYDGCAIVPTVAIEVHWGLGVGCFSLRLLWVLGSYSHLKHGMG